MASYTISYNGATSVTFTVTGCTVGGLVRILFRPVSTNTLLYDIAFRATSTTFTKTFPDGVTTNVYEIYTANDYYTGGLVPIDLDPDTAYTGRVRVKSSTSATSWTELGTASWTTPSTTDWDWAASNGSATVSQTQTAYEAITNNGYLSDFSYKVWNDMVTKTYEIAIDRNGVWNTTYGSYSDTIMTASDKAMTAQRFNAVWRNLAQFVSTGLSSARVTGDTVMGNYFVLLATAINKAIWRGTITYNPDG